MKAIRYSLILISILSVSHLMGQVKYESYGSKIDDSSIASLDLLSDLSSADTLSMKVKAVVLEVCQSKGCWMTLASPDGTPIRVTFKDYGFFVPKDIAGKSVIVNGIVSKSKLSEKTAKHYAEDAGQEYDPSKEYVEYAFEADGVLISQE